MLVPHLDQVVTIQVVLRIALYELRFKVLQLQKSQALGSQEQVGALLRDNVSVDARTITQCRPVLEELLDSKMSEFQAVDVLGFPDETAASPQNLLLGYHVSLSQSCAQSGRCRNRLAQLQNSQTWLSKGNEAETHVNHGLNCIRGSADPLE